jgi:hypothetical protein
MTSKWNETTEWDVIPDFNCTREEMVRVTNFRKRCALRRFITANRAVRADRFRAGRAMLKWRASARVDRFWKRWALHKWIAVYKQQTTTSQTQKMIKNLRADCKMAALQAKLINLMGSMDRGTAYRNQVRSWDETETLMRDVGCLSVRLDLYGVMARERTFALASGAEEDERGAQHMLVMRRLDETRQQEDQAAAMLRARAVRMEADTRCQYMEMQMRAAERRNAAMGQLDQLALEAHVDDMQRFDLHYEREDRKLKRDVQAVERLRVQREHDGLMHSCQ